jgi:hypothetical protein
VSASYPNRVCVCGYTRFREHRATTTEVVERWMLYTSVGGGGFGSTPFGTYFGGGGPAEGWGLFEANRTVSSIVTTCESCDRVRARKTLGGITPYATMIEDNYLLIIVADAPRPIVCYSLRLTGPSGEFYELPLSLRPGAPAAVAAPEPDVTAESPPAGGVLVDTVLEALLPEVPVDGEYLVTLIDSCAGTETALATVSLEALMSVVLSPLDADLDGAPAKWLHGSKVDVTGQITYSGRLSVPFDKCTAVIEYDARGGVMPDDEDWVRSGTGTAANWAFVGGGALQVQVAAPNTNFYTKFYDTATLLTRAYMYAVAHVVDVPAGGDATGFAVRASYGPLGGPTLNDGINIHLRDDEVFHTKLDLSASYSTGEKYPPGWVAVGGADEAGLREVRYESSAEFASASILAADTYGQQNATRTADQLSARFGILSNPTGAAAMIRRIVASDARFIRARFTAYTQAASPVLRLYVSAEQNASVSKLARFVIQYGVGTSDPYAPLPLSVSATVNLAVPNQVYELAIDLPGLTANRPFWFSVERDWDHADDAIEATVHLFQATVRTQ